MCLKLINKFICNYNINIDTQKKEGNKSLTLRITFLLFITQDYHLNCLYHEKISFTLKGHMAQ